MLRATDITDDTSIITLQTILFYRALRVPLAEIRHLLCVPLSEQAALLKAHLLGLRSQYDALSDLIHRVETTPASMKGDYIMQNSIQFEDLKQTIVQENEALYGDELRPLYGDEQIAQSNAKIQGMTQGAIPAGAGFVCTAEDHAPKSAA